MGQELLTTFEDELHEVTLRKSDVSGVFDVRLNGELIFSRKERGHFPDIKELKQLVRDVIAPERPLGHSDKQ